MRFLNLSFSTPAANLACDEALLDWREEERGGEILRFWESPEPFVVVGYANKIGTEVNASACEAKNIPVYRRCSGGGTVLQGPGCLNYALILRIEAHPALTTISSADESFFSSFAIAVLFVIFFFLIFFTIVCKPLITIGFFLSQFLQRTQGEHHFRCHWYDTCLSTRHRHLGYAEECGYNCLCAAPFTFGLVYGSSHYALTMI